MGVDRDAAEQPLVELELAQGLQQLAGRRRRSPGRSRRREGRLCAGRRSRGRNSTGQAATASMFETDVVEPQRAGPRRRGRRRRSDSRSPQAASTLGAEADGRRNSAGSGRHDRPGLQPAAGLGEARPPAAVPRSPRRPHSSRARRSPRSTARRARGRRPPSQLLRKRVDVARAAALRGDPAARAQGGAQPLEEQVVIENPVEDRAREDRVDRLRQRELGQIGDHRLVPRAEHLAHALDHRGRSVDGDDPARAPAARSAGAVTRPLPQPASSTVSSPASGEAVEDRPRPLFVRDGDALVALVASQSRRAPALIRGSSSPARGTVAEPSKASIAAPFSSVIAMSSRPFSSRCLTSGSTANSKTPAAQVIVSSSTSMRASPAAATARQCSSSRIAGSSPILVQLT